MPFQKLPNQKGQIYIPEYKKLPKKHFCRDCFACQWCSNDRCDRCRPIEKKNKKRPK